MKRSKALAGIGVVMGLSCLPTDPCACSPPGDHAVVFGTLRTAGGVAIPNGTIAADVGILSQCDFTGVARIGPSRARSTRGAKQGEADIAIDDPAAGSLEPVYPLDTDAEVFEQLARNPILLAAGIHHHIVELALLARVCERRNSDRCPQDSHVVDHRASVA